MLTVLLDFLFPRRSLTGDEGDFITEAELRSLRSTPVIVGTNELRARGMMHIDRIVAAAAYDSVPLLKKAVQIFKYRKIKSVGETLGSLVSDTSMVFLPRADRDVGEGSPVLCPVPLHWVRKFSRGFNQSEVLASIVGWRRGWEVRNLLKRNRWTGSQVGRTRKERLHGVKDAFEIGLGLGFGLGQKKIPEHVILVDDLSTTGATLDACAEILKKSGVKTVEGLVIALG